MLDGVVVSESKAQKDELILEGNDVQNVSQSGTSPPCMCKKVITQDSYQQLHLSRVYAVCGTRISVNSWTVSTFQTRARSHRSNFAVTFVISSVCYCFLVDEGVVVYHKSSHATCHLTTMVRIMNIAMSAPSHDCTGASHDRVNNSVS